MSTLEDTVLVPDEDEEKRQIEAIITRTSQKLSEPPDQRTKDMLRDVIAFSRMMNRQLGSPFVPKMPMKKQKEPKPP